MQPLTSLLGKAVSLTVRVYQVQDSFSKQSTANPFSKTNSQRREETENSLSRFPM